MQLIDTSKRRSTWRSCGGMYCPTLAVPHDGAPGCRFSQRRGPAVRSDACCCSVREYHYRIRRRAGRNRMRRRLGWCDGQPAWWPQVGGGPLNTHGSDFSMWRPSGAMGHTPLPRECMPLPTAEIRKKSRWSKMGPKSSLWGSIAPIGRPAWGEIDRDRVIKACCAPRDRTRQGGTLRA